MMIGARPQAYRRFRIVVGAVVVVGLTLGGAACTKKAKPKAHANSSNGASTAESSPPAVLASSSTASTTVASGSAPFPADKCTYKTYAGGVEKIDLKAANLAFVQSEKDSNPFAAAETASMKAEAKKLGYTLTFTSAGGDLNQEITDIKSMVAQGVKALIVSPLKSEGLKPVLDEARQRKVPVFTVDRPLSSSFKPCTDYIGFAGSNFVDQGRRAGEAMIKATGGSARAVTLLGAGGTVTDDRTKGYRDAIAGSAGIKVVAEQAGDSDRAKSQAATTQLLASHPDLNAIYAQSDDMALGAVAALKAAGKQPGDVRIVTIGGTKDAVQAIVDGWIDGAIESNPLLGQIAFASLDAFYNGDGVPAKQIISEAEYTKDNAKDKLGDAY